MSDLLKSLKEVASFVLLDGSPLLGHADALSLAPLVDGVLLVVDARRTTVAAVE
jgi:Mrp family chromosome partitioning ATPase